MNTYTDATTGKIFFRGIALVGLNDVKMPD